VSLLWGWPNDMNNALRDGYDTHGWLKEDALDRLRGAGLSIHVSVEEPKYNSAIWEIGNLGGEVQLALWTVDPIRKKRDGPRMKSLGDFLPVPEK
jgi:hypothetical protein